MEKTMTFDEWWRVNGREFNRITAQSKRRMRIAFDAGQQSQQAKVEELQKQLIDQGQRFNEQSQRVKDLEHKNDELQNRVDALEKAEFTLARIRSIVSKNLLESILIREVRQALKGEGL